MDVLFLMRIFWLYPGLELSFEHNNLFAKTYLKGIVSVRLPDFFCEFDQKFKFGGAIGYGDS